METAIHRPYGAFFFGDFKMKAYIVLADVDGREVHLPLAAIGAVLSLVGGERPGMGSSSEKSTLLGCEGAGLQAVLTPPRAANHNKYTPQFRSDAVRRYVDGNESVVKTAELLRIPVQTLDKWIRDRCGTTDRRFIRQPA